MLTAAESERFSRLLAQPMESMHISAGVGTLSEKYLHAFLKHYYEPDEDCHEVGIGKFTADICRDMSIIEIQTRSLDKLREKLEYYLLEGYSVNIVHPLPHVKWISWVDPESGEASPKRRTGKKGCYFDALWELYKIKYFLDWDRLKVTLMLIDMEEYRNLDGCGAKKKRRSTRKDRIPVKLYDVETLEVPKDYERLFLPDSLSVQFTAAEYAAAAGLRKDGVFTPLNILQYMGVINVAGKEGRRYVYRRCLNYGD